MKLILILKPLKNNGKTVMKKISLQRAIIFLTAIVCFLSGCAREDDPIKEPIPGNGGALTITKVKCCSLNVKWKSADDDQDAPGELKYKLVRSAGDNISGVSDAETNGITVKDWFKGDSSDISADVFGLTSDVAHYFNVIVKDPGNHKSAYQTKSASTVMTWADATNDAPWAGRGLHGVLVFNNKIWVLGGYAGYDNNAYTYKNDVWSSSDGEVWDDATNDAPWSVRAGHSALVFDDKMWVIGGYDGSADSYKNDVWYSSDGKTWADATNDAPWSIRNLHSGVVFDGKMWVIGGSRRITYYRNDVWYSSDGRNWTQATSAAAWSARDDHSSVVFDGKIWVIGGKGEPAYSAQNPRGKIVGRWPAAPKNDVWYSSDGKTWTQAVGDAPWPGRSAHASVVFNNKMWVIGGDGDEYLDGPMNNIWRSSDGKTWTRAGTPLWSGRRSHGALIFENKIRVIGGRSFNYTNDVWSGD